MKEQRKKLFEHFLKIALGDSALQKNLAKSHSVFSLIRPFSSHARSGPLTPGQGSSGRYFWGQSVHAESLAHSKKGSSQVTTTSPSQANREVRGKKNKQYDGVKGRLITEKWA